jgi:methenyltetrahydrofolate cyclohydrolase
MSLAAKPLSDFMAELASAEPVPGGGSVAALGGALGASLVAMVCRLTIDKKGYESVRTELELILPRAESLQYELRELMQADIQAYARVMDAYQMAKSTEAEKTARQRAVEVALKHASDVPLTVAERCADVLALIQMVAAKGNKNAASDAGVGALMAEAGLRGAALNVSINLGSIKDEAYVNEKRSRAAELVVAGEEFRKATLLIVQGRM